MAGTNYIPDGNAEIAAEVPQLVEVLARVCRWVHPEVFRRLPVWSPWAARGRAVYDARWSTAAVHTRQGTGETIAKREGNIAASEALVAALGVMEPRPKNWAVCHIWGYDDPAFVTQNQIVKDPRYFTCVGNMVWIPAALKGCADALPQVKTMLRTCAFHLYGFVCEHESVTDQAALIRSGPLPEGYPESWPCPARPDLLPPGTGPCSVAIFHEIDRRKARFRALLANPELPHFPRDEVRQVLEFWKIELE